MSCDCKHNPLALSLGAGVVAGMAHGALGLQGSAWRTAGIVTVVTFVGTQYFQGSLPCLCANKENDKQLDTRNIEVQARKQNQIASYANQGVGDHFYPVPYHNFL